MQLKWRVSAMSSNRNDKFIKSKWDKSTGRKRKWYVLTATGHKRLKQQATQWYEYADCLRRMLAPVVDVPEPI